MTDQNNDEEHKVKLLTRVSSSTAVATTTIASAVA